MYKIVQRKRKRAAQRDDEEDNAQTDSDESPPGSDSEDVSAGEESDMDEPLPMPEEFSDDDEPPISAKTVLSQPIQLDPGSSGRSACLICPRKILKHGKMVEVHVSSGAHLRRMKRFSTITTTLASEGHDTSDDFRVILQLMDAATTDMMPHEPKVGTPKREKLTSKGKQMPSRRERRLSRKEAIDEAHVPTAPSASETIPSGSEAVPASPHVAPRHQTTKRLEGKDGGTDMKGAKKRPRVHIVSTKVKADITA